MKKCKSRIALGIVIIAMMVTITVILLSYVWKPLTTMGSTGMFIYVLSFIVIIPYIIYLFMWKGLVPLMFGK